MALEIGSDPIVEPVVPIDGVPTPNVELDVDMFDIVDENSNEPTADDLAAQVEAMRLENEKLKQSADLSAGMQQGFQTLAQQLQGGKPDYSNLPGMPDVQAQQVQNYQLPDRESFEKDFFTSPYDSFTKMLAPVIGNQQAQMTTQMDAMNKMISKNQVYMDTSNKEILSKYGDEVEAYASRLTGANPYGDAVKQVTMNHFNDIMTDKTRSAEEAAYAKAKADFEAASQNLATAQASPVGMTNMGTNTNPGTARVRITKGEMDKVKAMTTTKFGPNSGPEVELQMYNYMKDNGML